VIRRGAHTPHESRRFAAVGAVVALAVILAAAAWIIRPWDPVRTEVVQANLDHPWDIAFTDDGRMLVTERIGRVLAQRAAGRSKPGGYGEWTVSSLNELLRDTPHIGLRLDTSEQTAEQTMHEIVRRTADARVG